jgi:monoamine oxidase
MSAKTSGFTRRSFLAATGAVLARPRTGAAGSGSVDVVIIGAGAAGIAAARRIAAAGRSYLLIEAADHVGGRCITDVTTFGVPYDRGARWIYWPDTNPLTKAVPRRGIDLYPAPQSQKVRIGRRYARESELEDFLSVQVRATRAINDMARKADVPCEQAMPRDLGDWASTVAFMLGPYECGKDLAQVSSVDLARSPERNVATFCRQGFGALLATLAQGLNIRLSTPAKMINSRGVLTVTTDGGDITARTVIVTVATNVVASGGLRFTPDLGHRQIDAFGRMSLGSYDHIAIELTGNPLGLEPDDLVFEKSSGTRTAAILANIGGTPLCFIEVAGSFGRDLTGQGEAAMYDFATAWLADLYGADVKNAIGRRHATRWNSDPYVLGAWSAAVPGSQFARQQLMDVIADDVWYAGEAAHETLWGTVGGAWESGERAADAVLHRLGGLKPTPAEAGVAPQRRARRSRDEAAEPRDDFAPQFYEGTPRIMAPER